MIDQKICGWLMESADAPVKYGVARELLRDEKTAKNLEGELFENGYSYPLIYDIISMHRLYELNDPAIDEKIDCMISYTILKNIERETKGICSRQIGCRKPEVMRCRGTTFRSGKTVGKKTGSKSNRHFICSR